MTRDKGSSQRSPQTLPTSPRVRPRLSALRASRARGDHHLFDLRPDTHLYRPRRLPTVNLSGRFRGGSGERSFTLCHETPAIEKTLVADAHAVAPPATAAVVGVRGIGGASGEAVCRPRATVAHRMAMAVGPPCPSYWTFWIAWTRSGEGDHHVPSLERATARCSRG